MITPWLMVLKVSVSSGLWRTPHEPFPGLAKMHASPSSAHEVCLLCSYLGPLAGTKYCLMVTLVLF